MKVLFPSNYIVTCRQTLDMEGIYKRKRKTMFVNGEKEFIGLKKFIRVVKNKKFNVANSIRRQLFFAFGVIVKNHYL
jgi:hypothetical protein